MFKVQLIHHQKLGAFLVIAFMSLWFSSAYAVNDKLNQLEVQAEAFQKGLDFAQKGSLKQALKVWEELSQQGNLIPELKRAIENNIAVVLIKQKRYEEAKKRLDLALQSDAQVATTIENLNQIYAYDAQKAYQKIFKNTSVNTPKAKWLYFDVKRVNLPSDNVITDEKNADSVRLVKKAFEQWRQAWANQDIKSYLSFYDKKSFIPKDCMNYKTWEKSRYRSLQRPKFIKVFFDDITITPISSNMIRTRFLQRYHSDRFKDDVYKVILWKRVGSDWKIVQEVVLYGGQ
jgi:tetratricopeptide (TPR) repeat protein